MVDKCHRRFVHPKIEPKRRTNKRRNERKKEQMEQPPKLPQEKTADAIHRRLEEHDRNRIAVQNELDGICKGLLEEIDKMEEREIKFY